MPLTLDGNTVNAATIVAGSLAVFVRPVRRLVRKQYRTFTGPCWQSQKVIADFINGASAVPFALLATSALHPHIAPILATHTVTMAVAGAIGLIFVVGEILTAGRDD